MSVIHDWDIVPEAIDFWLAGRWEWSRMTEWYR